MVDYDQSLAQALEEELVHPGRLLLGHLDERERERTELADLRSKCTQLQILLKTAQNQAQESTFSANNFLEEKAKSEAHLKHTMRLMDEQRSKSEADLKHELLTMQVQATQQMASNGQRRRLENEELASQLRTMRDANAGILRQEQEAITTARALEEATQATIRNAELKHQSDQEQMRQLATRAEQMVASADKETTPTVTW